MAQSILIKDTTREERAQIVREALGGEFGCDGCGTSTGSIDAMYQPYIDGELELREVNMRGAATRYVVSEGTAQRSSRCPM